MIRLLLTPFLLLLFALGLAGCKGQPNHTPAEAEIDSARICKFVFNADSALAFVRAQCNFGPRTPNSPAIAACGDYLVAQFQRYGLSVTEHREVLPAWDGQQLRCRNIIASYQPEATERVLIAAHYDTRPWSDHDPDSTRHHQPVLGANDGASGIAVMLEIARQLSQLRPNVGVDFICFDTEDYGAPYWAPLAAQNESNNWCMGSQAWARQAAQKGYVARYGILLDMVGGKGSRFHYEGFSVKYAQSLLLRVWDAAKVAGAADYFVASDGGFVTDDHVPVNEIAGIPMIDIIPFAAEGNFCEQWHTTADTPEALDPQTLRAVGQTLLQFLSEEK